MLKGRVKPLSVVVSAGLVLSACASAPSDSGAGKLSGFGQYQCGQLDLRVTQSDDSDLVGVEYLNRRVLLKPIKSASGARYQAPGDPDTEFWSRGERGTFTLRGQTFPECLEPGAIETGFRGFGTEPFWDVTIDQDRMTLSRPYDQQVIEGIALNTTLANQHGRAYEATVQGMELSFRVAHQLCEDDMAGAQYPAQVRLTLDGETFKGCGGDRHRLFRGAEWVVEDLAGESIIDRSRITLRFLEGNRVAGRASCNRYMGGYNLTGEGLSFTPLASTMMACAPALMNQERRFLGLMETVVDGRIDREGALVLRTADGDTLRAYQAETETPGS
jgi:heat shock protein HslJ/membrane-bound inhibitor of C-type lysozyme